MVAIIENAHPIRKKNKIKRSKKRAAWERFAVYDHLT